MPKNTTETPDEAGSMVWWAVTISAAIINYQMVRSPDVSSTAAEFMTVSFIGAVALIVAMRKDGQI